MMDYKASRLLKRSITKKLFSKWHQQRNNWKYIHQKNILEPVIFWSRSLCSKVLNAWKKYLDDKKDFQNQIQNALKSRKEHMLKNGLIGWLKVSFCMSTKG